MILGGFFSGSNNLDVRRVEFVYLFSVKPIVGIASSKGYYMVLSRPVGRC
jgi:hypothetical protein